MKYIKQLILSALLITLMDSAVRAEPHVDLGPLVRALTRTRLATTSTIVPDSVVATIGEEIVYALQADLLSFDKMGTALQMAEDRAALWQKLGIIQLEPGDSSSLATAMATQKNLEEAIKILQEEEEPWLGLNIIEDQMGYRPLCEPSSNSLKVQDIYPEKVAKGLFQASNDILRFIRSRNNKLYTYLVAKHAPALRRNIYTFLNEIRDEVQMQYVEPQGNPIVWAAKQIPEDTDTLFIMERHEKWLPPKLIPMLDIIKAKAKDREVIFLVEFLNKGHVLQFKKDFDSLKKYTEDYLPLWEALDRRNILTIGLEPTFVEGTLEDTGLATDCDFVATEDGKKSKDQEKMWESLEGMRIRNQHWLNMYKKVRSDHPKALIVFYSGEAHTSYLDPFTLVREIEGKNFNIEVIAKEADMLDYLVYPLELPDCVAFSPRLAPVTGFNIRVKLENPKE